MSVPFSNTNLRIPRGFGNLLEGLAKEVLRDQPEDIPTFAARYFSELLKAREESGLDPAEWGARLEDRFYNNHTFKVQETATKGSFGSSKANTSSSAGDTKTYGNNGTQQSNELNANNSLDNLDEIEVKKKYELDKKLDEQSGEAEHGPAAEISHVGRTDVDICAEEVRDPSEFPGQVSENTDIPRNNKIDVCRSELDPTPLPSFGGLANVDVCAEEINPPLTEDNKGPESQDVQNLPESFNETPSHIDHDKGKQADEMSDDENTEEPETDDHIKKTELDVSEIADTFLDDTGLEEESTEMVYLEESTERTNALDMTETRITSTTEAGTEEHIEEREELMDSEDQEVNHEYSSTIDIVEDEPAGETTGMKDTFIVYSGETYDSRSEIIDVLDEVVMGSEHEAGDNTDEQSSSKMMDALEEEELLESQTHAPEPDSQLSDTEVTEDVTGKEVLNTDVMDTSEKDPVTETINEASDLDSDCCDAEEIDQDDVVKVEEDPTKSTTFDDLSSMREQDIVTTVDVTNDSELKEDVLASETQREAEVTDEHHMEAQEQSEQTVSLDSENPESSEEKEECNQPHEEEDIMDIPLDDPEANKAAAKIQAGFRGHMTRKKMKPDEKTGDEVSSSGEALNGSEGDTAGGTDGVETDTTSGPEQ